MHAWRSISLASLHRPLRCDCIIVLALLSVSVHPFFILSIFKKDEGSPQGMLVLPRFVIEASSVCTSVRDSIFGLRNSLYYWLSGGEEAEGKLDPQRLKHTGRWHALPQAGAVAIKQYRMLPPTKAICGLFVNGPTTVLSIGRSGGGTDRS